MDTMRRLAVSRQAMMPEQSMDTRMAAILTISPAEMLTPVMDMTAAMIPPYMP